MSKDQKKINFTQALRRLEEIVEALENPNLELEEGLKLLEEGVNLHRLCKNKLTEANAKISNILRGEGLKDGEVS